jgi:hypothetical protein
MRRAGQAAALGAALALALAGCGGESRLSKAEYERALVAEGKTLKSAAGAINVDSRSELKRRIGDLHRQLDKAAETIGGLKPPENAEADNRKIAAGLRRLADDFGRMERAAKADDSARVQQIAQQIVAAPEIADLMAATKDLKAKGYEVGSLGN